MLRDTLEEKFVHQEKTNGSNRKTRAIYINEIGYKGSQHRTCLHSSLHAKTLEQNKEKMYFEMDEA